MLDLMDPYPKPVKLIYGIPQGSCLGATLFMFYINEIFSEIKYPYEIKVADDCVLYDSGKSWLDTHTHLQAGLDKYIARGNEHN